MHSTTLLWGTCVLWCPGVWAGWGQPRAHRSVPGDAHHLLFQDRGSQPQLGSDPPRQPIRSQHLLSERQTGALQAAPGGWEAVGSPLTWVGSHPQVGDAVPDHSSEHRRSLTDTAPEHDSHPADLSAQP